MKSLIMFILSAFVLSAVAPCGGADIRKVENGEVDLQPLIDWNASKGNKKGDRPLKHWKLVEVVEQKGQAPYPILMCDIEGSRSEIMLRNCPAALVDLLRQKKDLEAKLKEAMENEDSASERRANASTGRQIRQANRSHNSAKEIEKNIQKDLNEVKNKIKEQRVYAMFTGTKSGGVPVWDTGLTTR